MAHDTPTTVIVRFTARPGLVRELGHHLGHAIPHLSELDGCIGGSLFNDTDEPDVYVLVEHWTSVEAHRAYVDRIEHDGTMDELMPLLAEPPNRRYLTPV